jgi:hypothetical protein
MRTNLQRLADHLVPMSEDRVREVLRQGETQASSQDAGFDAVESSDGAEYWACAPTWPDLRWLHPR